MGTEQTVGDDVDLRLDLRLGVRDGSAGAQGGFAASVFYGTGIQNQTFETGSSSGGGLPVLFQGVYGLGGGDALNVSGDGADFGADTRLSAGEYVSFGTILFLKTLAIATPTFGCTAKH